MGREARCEAPPVPRSARSVLSYVSTHRRKRWRIATWIATQVPLFLLDAELDAYRFAQAEVLLRDAEQDELFDLLVGR